MLRRIAPASECYYVSFIWLLKARQGRNVLSIMAYTGRLPGRGNSVRLPLDERVGISFRAVKRFKGLKESTDAFQAHEKVEKTFWFCDLFVLKDSASTAVKRDVKF